MPLPDLIIALTVLLLSPGPTNTLMALAGAERGLRNAAGLIPLELCAYLCVTVPLALAGAGLMTALPGVLPVVTAVAAIWVLWLAIRMWRRPVPQQVASATVTPLRVFLTTLLNPKALIIGLVLLPGPSLPLRTAVFAALVCSAALAWISLGAVLARRGSSTVPGLTPLLRRSAAVWLGLLSAALAFRAVFA
jgi:threonine/homoserine/homoserine lactone efflux protein